MAKGTVNRTSAQRRAWRNLSHGARWWIKNNPHNKWKTKIRREYQYQCAWCKKDKNLEAHHIKLRSLFPLNTTDLDNGCLLCTKCHDNLHAILTSEGYEPYLKLCWDFMQCRKPTRKNKKSKPRNESGFVYTYDSLIDAFKNLESKDLTKDKPRRKKRRKKKTSSTKKSRKSSI